MIQSLLWLAVLVLALLAVREVWRVHRALFPRTDREWIGMAMIFAGMGGLLLLAILR